MKAAINDQPIAIVADEVSDSKGRRVFAILLRTMTPTPHQAIIDCIKEYDIKYHNILGLVSDSARYMKKCFQVLQTIIGYHLLCSQVQLGWRHISQGIFKSQPPCFKTKNGSFYSRKLKSCYLNFHKERNPSLLAFLFPALVITCWNSWFHAIQYLYKHLDAVASFFLTMLQKNLSSSTFDVVTMFQDKQLSQQLKIQITFVSKYTHGVLPSETEKVVNLCTNVKTKEKLKEKIRQSMQRCFAKLDTHMQGNQTNEFYMAVNSLFDPTIAEVSKEYFIENYENFHDQLGVNIRSNNEIDCLQMLLALNIDAERFFSKYIIVTDNFNRMTEETIETCFMLACN
ncbi:hypothetical protein PR048_015513, partial [Dryococelus australis]